MPHQFVDHIPYYYQLKEILLSKLRSGEYAVGDQLPPELDLVREFGVSRPTVRRAMAELVQEGYLERARGRGTFVSRPAVMPDARVLTTFAGEVQQSGRQHSVTVIGATVIPAVGALARDLAVPDGAPVFEITRLRTGDGEPLVLEISQVPQAFCPNLLQEADLAHEGLYDALNRLQGIRIGRAEQVFQAVAAGPQIAQTLNVRRGSPLLLWQGVAYSLNDQPVERLRVYYRGDRYRFSIHQSMFAGSGTDMPLGSPGALIGVMATGSQETAAVDPRGK